jgi:hypothetical protein
MRYAVTKKKSAGAKYFGKPVTDDAPELLGDFFRHGELRHGDRLVRRGPAAPVRQAKNGNQASARSAKTLINLAYLLTSHLLL